MLTENTAANLYTVTSARVYAEHAAERLAALLTDETVAPSHRDAIADAAEAALEAATAAHTLKAPLRERLVIEQIWAEVTK